MGRWEPDPNVITANRQNAIKTQLWGSQVSLGINLWEALKEADGIFECTNVFWTSLKEDRKRKPALNAKTGTCQ